MDAHRLYAASKRRRQVCMKKFTAAISAFVLIMCMSILLGCNFSDASDSREDAPVEYRYYKSIEIQPGDTLWGIAEEFMTDEYSSVNEYINEVKKINGLGSDDIQESQYLTIAYYDTEFR
ncbi:LysM peptidoglycan-binding domain-containing protein [Dorea sp. D27]|uniref:LysM peptidoglycan-binding domain-containing protein n=1 Tax=Dorea sp. D27 TaxID=658665 RepID=UPI0006738120|nr:LysM peptidoglycan-binding domain-containing protein [Dorea sp. D27]KMZ54971.1 putative LysM domain protein [Dorea sp. D27]